LIIYQSWFSIAEFTHVSQVAEIPMQALHLVIPFSFALMIVAALTVAINEVRRTVAGEAAAPGSANGVDEPSKQGNDQA
jgi:TRAP-type C4-dicarboxylate transport system permease small subunit